MPKTGKDQWVEVLISAPNPPQTNREAFCLRIDDLIDNTRKLIEDTLSEPTVIVRHSYDSPDGQFHLDLVTSLGFPDAKRLAEVVNAAFSNALTKFNQYARTA